MKIKIKNMLAWYHEKSFNIKLNKKINEIYRHLNKQGSIRDTENTIIDRHIAKWSVLQKKINPNWLHVYSSITEAPSPDYIPESVYYMYVEPVLNNKFFSIPFRDKNYYDLLYSDNCFPEVFLRNIDGIFYDDNYCRMYKPEEVFNSLKSRENIIAKPSFISGGGHQISLLVNKNGRFLNQDHNVVDFESIQSEYKRNYNLQEYIRQHEFTRRFNESSLNTFRLLTYRSVGDDRIHVLHTVFRIGKKGSITDNQASGGIAVGVDPSGRISDFGVDKKGNKYFGYNNIPFSSAGVIPRFNEMKETVQRLSKSILYSRLIGWDICLDQNENIKVIEMNNIHNEINFYQMNSAPLFRQFTDEVIDYCRQNPGTYSINFYKE